MTDDRWQRVVDLYQSAHDRAPEERSSFIRQMSAGDSDLRREVESLLAEDDSAIVLDAPIDAAAHSWLDDNSAVQPGSFIGPYRIDSLLGVGGMGEVYRARDTKLNREVAIKILPGAFASDPDRLARFRREAQVLAALNHPNIAAIHGFEDSGGVHALVLELVEGPTLADRIANGPIRIDEALPIARQIADALEAAHEQGVIHRDLKPANIKVRDDGTVKVLDFGLAKLAEPVGAASGVQLTQSPTITTPAMTAAGTILGTAAYMSPEQAKGKPADKRSDIWAFGCVLYEMLTGKRAFEGEDVSDTLALILRSEPDWTRLPADTPSIRRLLRRALEKDRKRRLSDIGDARLELDEREHLPPTEIVQRGAISRERIAWVVALLLVVTGAAVLRTRSAEPAADSMRLELTTPPTSHPESIAVSPDGRALVFVGEGVSGPQLWLRMLSSEQEQALAGTDDALYPFWSADSRKIGFFAAGKLKRLDLETGSVRTLTPAPHAFGGSWSAHGTIVFSTGPGPVMSVSEEGGNATIVLAAKNEPRSPYFGPFFLPDGQHFLIYSIKPGEAAVLVASLRGGEPARLIDADAAAAYVRGHLLFVRNNTLYAQPFDPDRLVLSAAPAAVTAQTIALSSGGAAFGAFSTSATGTIAFRSTGRNVPRQFTWFNRSGMKLGTVGDIDLESARNPSLSPDGLRLAYDRTTENNTDVWLLDLSRGSPSRLTTDPGIDLQPIWLRDGSIIFSAVRRSAGYSLRAQSPHSPGGAGTLWLSEPSGVKVASDCSPDGEFVVFRTLQFNTGYDIWAVPTHGDRKAFPVIQTDANERDAQFSPDGKWIAYESDQSGRMEIYVQAFKTGSRPFGPLSTGGGVQPRWRSDGTELYYISPDRHLNAIPIKKLDAINETVDPQRPIPLFSVNVSGDSRQQYVVEPGGQRFLINLELDRDARSPMTMILNWAGVSKH